MIQYRYVKTQGYERAPLRGKYGVLYNMSAFGSSRSGSSARDYVRFQEVDSDTGMAETGAFRKQSSLYATTENASFKERPMCR